MKAEIYETALKQIKAAFVEAFDKCKNETEMSMIIMTIAASFEGTVKEACDEVIDRRRLK